MRHAQPRRIGVFGDDSPVDHCGFIVGWGGHCPTLYQRVPVVQKTCHQFFRDDLKLRTDPALTRPGGGLRSALAEPGVTDAGGDPRRGAFMDPRFTGHARAAGGGPAPSRVRPLGFLETGIAGDRMQANRAAALHAGCVFGPRRSGTDTGVEQPPRRGGARQKPTRSPPGSSPIPRGVMAAPVVLVHLVLVRIQAG